jgi:deoxyribonuclease V
MRTYPQHRWNLDYQQALDLQNELRGRIRLKPLSLSGIRYVAGADIAISKRLDRLVAVVVVYRLPDLEHIETRVATSKITFPYVPGLLSFREIPVLLDCFETVTTPAHVIVCDGQGIAHPRGVGLASHLGLLLRRPTIGCAKSRLVGEHGPVGEGRGRFAPLTFQSKRVGSVLRTRDGVKPVFVSPGHLVDHASSRRIVLACTTRYRLPEPTRLADRLAGEEKRRLEGMPE